MHYTMYLQDGDKYVDISRNRTINQFKVGSNQVFRGIDVGIQCMSVGERANLTILPTLAFGCNKMYENDEDPLIPANSTLILDVELLKVT
uniref:peptidylprolyl isomerase n=1 Tax=Ditylenchus dipsaci TaxID=166011 RepID=A0A915E3A7_9BILA